MIYREMPPIWDPAFSQRFYARWGRENAVISALTQHAEYPEYTQLLSIKMMTRGREDYFIDGRRIAVDDDTFLILNAGRSYASCIDSKVPGRSFSVFFRPRLAEEVRDALRRSTRMLLEDPEGNAQRAVVFGEQLREHDTTVTPVLRHIQRAVEDGLDDDLWLEEQLQFLLARMLKLEGRQSAARVIPVSKPAVRRELHRRLGLAVNHIHAHFDEPLGLRDLAREAHLSSFHFLRTFKAVYGMTPSAFLNRKRLKAALRLIRDTSLTLAEVAEHVGFGCRSTLFRHLRSAGVKSP